MKDYKDYIKKIKELEKEHYNLLDLDIAYEVENQIEKDYTDEELNKIMSRVENAYLKSDEVELWKIVKVVIDKFDELDNLSSWDIVEESCYI